MLAAKLGRTVDELRQTMSSAEFIGWGIYYARKRQREELAAATAGGGNGGDS